MTTFNDELDSIIGPARKPALLPSTATNGQVEAALESNDVDHLAMELQHTRSHYNSLELMVSDEARVQALIADGIEQGILPKPTTVEEAIALTTRVYAVSAVEAAYDAAHQTAFFIGALGMTVADAMKTIYNHLDWTDPETADLTDEAIAAFIAGSPDED